MEIKYIKSAARVLNRDCVNKGGLDLSKNVLWVSVDQGAADLRAVKVGGKKKFCRSAQFNPLRLHLADRHNFILTSNFDSS